MTPDRRAHTPIVCLNGGASTRWHGSPVRVLAAHSLEDVVSVLNEAEQEAEAGRTAIGFVAYEAAPAFDAALATHAPAALPLAWFAVFDAAGQTAPSRGDAPVPALDWRAEVDDRAYAAAVARIRDLIAAGDTYQVNYTYQTRAAFHGDPFALFRTMADAQPTGFGIYLDLGGFAVASVSPELFFRLDGDRITTRPMKGTAPRGLWSEDDARRGEALRESPKERAENVMIVDMIRNDLGRVARTGSVHVASLFDTERHPTVWQMTSTVEARTGAPIAEIFRALFPCASVTGAPKVRTMQIIRELERGPRGVYCGALGWIGPGRRAQFSVGIRTATIDRGARTVTFPVGSGVTWDSIAAAEHDECRLKASVLRHRRPKFELLESLKWEGGYTLLDEHLARLRESAAYFHFAFDESVVRRALAGCARELAVPSKVRLLVDRSGNVGVESVPLPKTETVSLALAAEPVDSTDVFLYHKTTHRAVYDGARALRPEAADVVLWNEHGEITESTVANLCIRIGDTWYTPLIAAGLLPGVMRAELLRQGRIHERAISIADFHAAGEVALINSVRGWIPATRIDAAQRAVHV